jgi:replicative superfamily II helicase
LVLHGHKAHPDVLHGHCEALVSEYVQLLHAAGTGPNSTVDPFNVHWYVSQVFQAHSARMEQENIHKTLQAVSAWMCMWDTMHQTNIRQGVERVRQL